MKFKAEIHIIILALTLLLCSCDGVTNTGSDIVFPDDSVSYTKHVEPFTLSNCALAGCHGAITAPNTYSMYNYFDYDNFLGLIIRGNPEGSTYYQVLIYGKYQSSKGIPHLTYIDFSVITDNQIKGIYTWIKEGGVLN